MNQIERQEELKRLEAFFQIANIPAGKINIDGYLTIHNPKELVRICLNGAYNGIENIWSEGNIHRLQLIENYIRQNAS